MGSRIKSNTFNRFRIAGLLGSGTFGEVYCARDLYTGEVVAVKLEKQDIKRPQVLREARIVRHLSEKEDSIGIPNVIYMGNTDQCNIMVQELLGRDLEDLYDQCNRSFSLKTILMLCDQILKRMKYVHSKSIIHRDIKPHNWTLGVGKLSNIVYIFDFGLAKKFRNSKGKHIAFRTDKSLVGTARYASINSHNGCEQSRRDDLESVGYMFIYWLKGKLPWQGLTAKSRKEKYEKIKNVKMKVGLKELCEGIPDQFRKYLEYVRNLKFDEDPDYDFLMNLFQELFVEKEYKMDFLFDWTFLRIGLINTDRVLIKPNLSGETSVKKFKKGRINPQL